MNYYVYVWIRMDTNKIFYVGYGTRYRISNISSRSEKFKQILNELKRNNIKFDKQIIFDNLSRSDAMDIEYYLIMKLLGEGQPLVNEYRSWNRTWIKRRKGM
jgi:hypothetical protein